MIAGTPIDGQTLTAANGSWSGTPPLTYAYQWQTCNSLGVGCVNDAGQTSSAYVLSPSDVATTLRVIVTASNAAGASSATSVVTSIVAARPPANTGLPVISGTPTVGQTLSSSTGSWSGTPPLTYAYQWESCDASGSGCANITGATSSSYVLLSGNIGGTIRVVVTATNAAGSASGTSVALTVQVPPSVTSQPQSLTVNEGQSASFTAAASGTPTPSVQWQSSGDGGTTWANVSGATSATLTVASAGRSLNGELYRAVFTNTAGSLTTSAATLTVDWIGPVTTHPANQTVTVGGAVSFSAAVSANPGATVQWQVSADGGNTWANDTTDASANTTMLTIASTTAPENGDQYRAVFANAAGSLTSAAATLTVQVPPSVTAQPQSATVNAGQSVSFTAAAAGNPTPGVQWQVSTDGGTTWSNDTTDSGASTGTLTLASASVSQNANQYRAMFTSTWAWPRQAPQL